MNLSFLVVRSILENKNISQRELARKFCVSLGKINSIIKSAEEDEYLIKNKTYEVTEKGTKFVTSHKVDGALILACGLGVRLAPLTYDTPKSFIKIKGERMIERQIEQLKSVGINDITIMVGYMKEKFDYLIDKYDVKLIYNEEYKIKNTLSTLYHAKDVLKNKNMYVCVSDVYIEENIYHTYEIEPYYIGAFYKDCSNEWRYLTNNKNEIKGVALDGENDYCLVGPCFLTKEFLEKFLPMIEKYYHMTTTDNYYWEDVLVNNLDKLPTIYVYKLGEGVIHEFDSLKDIKAFDKDNSEYGSEAITFVSRALKIKDNEIEDIECIKEGLTNHSYKFRNKGHLYIARVPGEGTQKFIDRKNEYEVYESLKNSNITEELVFFDKNNGYKISKYFENSKTIDINNENDLKTTMALYRKFHSLGIKVKSSCDIIDMLNIYLDIIHKKEINIPYEDFEEIMKKEREIERLVITEKRPRTLCHGDPNPGNILVTSDGYKMIDFEYAGMADPISDVALFGAYVEFDIDKTFKLYQMYKEVPGDKSLLPLSDEKARKLIIYYMALGGLYNAVWALVKEATSGIDYGCFGVRGYRIFKTCVKALQ